MNKENYKCVSGSTLKMIAITSMFIDHVAMHLLRPMPIARQALLEWDTHVLTLYTLMRTVGRLAFPIFAFLIVEGYVHTRNRMNYGRNLFLFALLSEIPWNLVHTNSLFWSHQNVFFTLLLGYLGICAIEYFREDRGRMAVSLLALLVISYVARADYGCTGFGFILLLYMLREHKLAMSVIGSCFLSSTWRAGLAFIPICLYNGKRGFIRGNILKYAFYVFYPLHLTIIYLIKLYLYTK